MQKSYVENNPLKYTDPSGHSIFGRIWNFFFGGGGGGGSGTPIGVMLGGPGNLPTQSMPDFTNAANLETDIDYSVFSDQHLTEGLPGLLVGVGDNSIFRSEEDSLYWDPFYKDKTGSTAIDFLWWTVFRSPDYFSLTVSSPPISSLGSLAGLLPGKIGTLFRSNPLFQSAGVSGTLALGRNGKLYAGLGPSIGVGRLLKGWTINLAMGFILQQRNSSDEMTQRFLTGQSYSAGFVSFPFGVFGTHVPGVSTAIEPSIGNPQISGTYHYSFEIIDTGITWGN